MNVQELLDALHAAQPPSSSDVEGDWDEQRGVGEDRTRIAEELLAHLLETGDPSVRADAELVRDYVSARLGELIEEYATVSEAIEIERELLLKEQRWEHLQDAGWAYAQGRHIYALSSLLAAALCVIEDDYTLIGLSLRSMERGHHETWLYYLAEALYRLGDLDESATLLGYAAVQAIDSVGSVGCYKDDPATAALLLGRSPTGGESGSYLALPHIRQALGPYRTEELVTQGRAMDLQDAIKLAAQAARKTWTGGLPMSLRPRAYGLRLRLKKTLGSQFGESFDRGGDLNDTEAVDFARRTATRYVSDAPAATEQDDIRSSSESTTEKTTQTEH